MLGCVKRQVNRGAFDEFRFVTINARKPTFFTVAGMAWRRRDVPDRASYSGSDFEEAASWSGYDYGTGIR